MSLTTGFLLLFFTIVIPGFLFLRAYYYGEFSKQFNPKENITKQLLFGIIPGSIIQLSCFLLGKKIGWISIDSMNLVSFFETVNNQKVSQSEEAQSLIENPVYLGYYLLIVYVLSFLSGTMISRSIRALGWDKSSKVLRFKNQWYYIFSGEIFEFKKFKSAANVLGRESSKDKIVQLAKVDILINNGGSNEFYSGYVVDYDLLPNDPSKLDNIYLMDAYRHTLKEVKKPLSKFVHPYISEKKHIPGEIFVLNMCHLVNINVSYLLSEKTAVEQNKWVKRLLIGINILLITLLIFSIYPIFFRVGWIDLDWYNSFHDSAWWLDKVLFFGLAISILGFPITSKNEETGNYTTSWRDLGFNSLALLGFGLAFWLVFVYL